MSTKRWKKSTPKKCTKKEEKELLEHLRRLGQYLAWLSVQPETPAVQSQIKLSEQKRDEYKARYKELVGR